MSWLGRLPHPPKRPRVLPCPHETEAECDCRDRDEAAYQRECERRYDAWKNGDDDGREQD